VHFVPGRPGTEEFVPGFLLLPLSRDKGTPGQENFFVPGQRDNGTSRPVETLVQINSHILLHTHMEACAEVFITYCLGIPTDSQKSLNNKFLAITGFEPAIPCPISCCATKPQRICYSH
jgi:hypothetical protein